MNEIVKSVLIDKDLIEILRNVSYEEACRKDIVVNYIKRGTYRRTSSFIEYQKLYTYYFTEKSKLMSKIEDDYLNKALKEVEIEERSKVPNIQDIKTPSRPQDVRVNKDWQVVYDKCELEIYKRDPSILSKYTFPIVNPVDEAIVNMLQSKQEDCRAKQDILFILINDDISLDDETVKFYHEEYKDAFVTFDIARQYVTDNCVPEELRSPYIGWDLNFNTGIITIKTN